MPSVASILFILTFASTIAPSLAAQSYPSYHVPSKDEIIIRELAHFIARTDESGAISWAEAKQLGANAWDKAKSAAKYIGPAVATAAQFLPLVVRDEPELWTRIDARDYELLRRGLEARAEESGAMSWSEVKAAGKKAFDKWSEFSQAVTPIIVNGVNIAQTIRGKPAPEPEAAPKLKAREDMVYELIARTFDELD